MGGCGWRSLHRPPTWLFPFLVTGGASYRERVGYDVTFNDERAESISEADAYVQEGPLTTFFRTRPRGVVDSWAVRLASFRTADIRAIRARGGVLAD